MLVVSTFRSGRNHRAPIHHLAPPTTQGASGCAGGRPRRDRRAGAGRVRPRDRAGHPGAVHDLHLRGRGAPRRRCWPRSRARPRRRAAGSPCRAELHMSAPDGTAVDGTLTGQGAFDMAADRSSDAARHGVLPELDGRGRGAAAATGARRRRDHDRGPGRHDELPQLAAAHGHGRAHPVGLRRQPAGGLRAGPGPGRQRRRRPHGPLVPGGAPGRGGLGHRVGHRAGRRGRHHRLLGHDRRAEGPRRRPRRGPRRAGAGPRRRRGLPAPVQGVGGRRRQPPPVPAERDGVGRRHLGERDGHRLAHRPGSAPDDRRAAARPGDAARSLDPGWPGGLGGLGGLGSGGRRGPRRRSAGAAGAGQSQGA